MREEIVVWILYHPNVKPACVSSDAFTFFHPESNIKEFPPKHVMDIYVRDIHNDMIKSSENGGLLILFYYVTRKVLISDTR